MLNMLIRFALSQRALIMAVSIVLLILGVKKSTELPVEVLPDLTKPTVTLLTEAPGFAPEEVETLVTIPMENALMGVSGVTRLRSINDISLSLIFVEFDWGTDIYQARQFVQERLGGIREDLPEGGKSLHDTSSVAHGKHYACRVGRSNRHPITTRITNTRRLDGCAENAIHSRHC